jgi:diguanylate cyclase (GGDEF)-like protein
MRILLVEDDESLADLIKKTLIERQNYVVDSAKDGYAGLELANAFEYDLILLDLMLPKLNGIDFCQSLRNKGDRTPILLLTAKDEIANKVKGLDAGADDYLVKPFDLQELLARIRALMRRGQDSQLPVVHWDNLSLDPNNCQASYRQQPLRLTAKEYSLLELFLRNPHRIFSQNALIDRLWDLEESPSVNAVRTQIKGLRQKLKAAGATSELIETIYGLGYRLKKEDAIAPETKPTATTPTSIESKSPSLNDSLNKIWQKHQATYLAKIELLIENVQKISVNNGNDDLQTVAIGLAHTLAGSLGTFGLREVSEQFRDIERNLHSWEQLTSHQQEDLMKLLTSLRQTLSNRLLPIANLGRDRSQLAKTQIRYSIPDREARLLIVDDDLALLEALKTEAKAWGLIVEVAQNLSQAREIINRQSPHAILLDLSFPSSKENGFELLQELYFLKSTVPVVVFTAKESFADRVKVARLGGKGFLQKPIAAADAIEAMVQVLQRSTLPDAKVLVVDDDPETLDSIRDLLEPWGCELTLLEDPQQFWNTLETTNPDLLILDVDMPYLSGIELCQVVRNDPRWHEIPVLSLSTRQDSQTIQAVFAVGADDYVQKPIVGPELVARILNRLDRERYRRQISEIDSLTGVSNRRKAIEQLKRMINLAKRQDRPFCFMLIDLDHFKKINDVYGHDAGDRVLRHMGKLLNYTFRDEDVIARWGGEEFAIGLYNMTKASGINRLQQLLKNVSQQEFSNAYEQKFQVTFSAGVAEYASDGKDLQTLYQAADAALYQAKTLGRNRVLGC